VNARKIRVCTENPKIKELLMEELEQVKAKDIDKDKSLSVVSKDMVKEKIGRSPDFSDTLAMRMWFELAPRPTITVIDLPTI
jgi:phage terminase large subunit